MPSGLAAIVRNVTIARLLMLVLLGVEAAGGLLAFVAARRDFAFDCALAGACTLLVWLLALVVGDQLQRL